jgi:hypothetical protein
MSQVETTALSSGGIAVRVPMVWYETYLPYFWDWTRWSEHSDTCAQCAHHLSLTGSGGAAPPACPVGAEMLADLRQSMDLQRTEALFN